MYRITSLLQLARYCDHLLRRSSKGVGEQEVEDRLEAVVSHYIIMMSHNHYSTFAYQIIVFRYIDDKDMFQRFHSKMLSRRLVQNLSLSMEAEESMIQKLKVGGHIPNLQACSFIPIRICG